MFARSRSLAGCVVCNGSIAGGSEFGVVAEPAEGRRALKRAPRWRQGRRDHARVGDGKDEEVGSNVALNTCRSKPLRAIRGCLIPVSASAAVLIIWRAAWADENPA